MFAGFRSRWMMPVVVRGLERVGDLARDRQRVAESGSGRAIRSRDRSAPSTSSMTSATRCPLLSSMP